jgi:hypothetical protein
MSRYDLDHDSDDLRDQAHRRPAEPSGRQENPVVREQGSSSGSDVPQQRATGKNRQREPNEVKPSRRTRHSVDRERTYQLRDSELRTLTDIGTFRALNLNDLVNHRYGGDLNEARRDLENLERQGLVLRRTVHPDKASYVTLSKSAYDLLKSKNSEQGDGKQAFYHGFVKDRQARHDAAIYRLYQQEVSRIERTGGKVRRVVLDFELKRSVNQKLGKAQSPPASDQAARKQEIAQEHHLPVVNGRIALPDLRLEYEGPDQEMGRVDLELVTGVYHHKSLARKAQTGFHMYGLPEDQARLRPALSDPEIMLDILSL